MVCLLDVGTHHHQFDTAAVIGLGFELAKNPLACTWHDLFISAKNLRRRRKGACKDLRGEGDGS
jgi:hypothetical protein